MRGTIHVGSGQRRHLIGTSLFCLGWRGQSNCLSVVCLLRNIYAVALMDLSQVRHASQIWDHVSAPGASFILQVKEVHVSAVAAQGKKLMLQTKQRNTISRPCIRSTFMTHGAANQSWEQRALPFTFPRNQDCLKLAAIGGRKTPLLPILPAHK